MTRYEMLDITNYENRVCEIFAKLETNAKMNDNGYSYEHILVCGEPAIKRFIQENNPDARLEETEQPASDPKCSAGFIPYICVKASADLRYNHGEAHFIADCYYIIGWLIFWGGEYYHLNRCDRNKTKPLHLFDDPTDYYNYLPYNWEKENPAPAKIGVLSDAKITAWVEYINKKISAVNAIKNARNNDVDEFLNRINNFDLAGVSDYNITDTRGYILKNGLMFTYQITNTGYIQTELKVYTNIHDSDKLANFELMANGNYKSKKI